jgi:hypothetical protein
VQIYNNGANQLILMVKRVSKEMKRDNNIGRDLWRRGLIFDRGDYRIATQQIMLSQFLVSISYKSVQINTLSDRK